MSHAALLVAIAPTQDIEAAVSAQMEPFDENGAWFADGSRWDWWQIGGRYSGLLAEGDVVRRGDLDLAAVRARRLARLTETYREAAAEVRGRPGLPVELLYGFNPRTLTLDQYLASRAPAEGQGFPAHFAFLHNREWHESGRLGWFGSRLQPECAVRTAEGVCLFEKDGAKVINWGSDDEDADWNGKFYARFVEPLPPDTLLVTVDYHV